MKETDINPDMMIQRLGQSLMHLVSTTDFEGEVVEGVVEFLDFSRSPTPGSRIQEEEVYILVYLPQFLDSRSVEVEVGSEMGMKVLHPLTVSGHNDCWV